MFRLGHENGGTALLPGITFLEHRAELVLSDAAIASEKMGKVAMEALTQNGKVIIALEPARKRRTHNGDG